MRSRFLPALVGGALIVACSGDALASPLPLSTCYDVGLACLNAGPAGDQSGICVASTCYDLLDASYACGVCELADAGGADGGLESSTPDASMPDSDVADAHAGFDGSVSDAAPLDGAAGEDAESTGGSSSGGSSSGGGSGSSSGSAAGSSSGVGTSAASSSGGAEDAGPDLEQTMPGCSASPLPRTGPTGLAVLALGVVAAACARRRRAHQGGPGGP
jgi:uncharacterized membrane protein YgcG